MPISCRRTQILQDFDICIIGAGAAGIAMAQRLTGSPLKVLLLVSGHPGDRADSMSRPGYRDASWPIDRSELTPFYLDAHQFGQFGPFNYDDIDFWQDVLYARCFDPLPGDKMTGAIMHAQYEENLHDFQVQFRDQLGRGFMVHPLLTNAARVHFEQAIPSEIRNFFREQQIRFKPPELEGGDYQHMVAPLVNPELVFEYLMFNAWGVLVPRHETLIEEKISNFRIILYFGAEHASATVNLNWEQVPDEDSRITLNRGQLDPIFGQPVAHVDWRLNKTDKRSAERALEITLKYLQQRGGTRQVMITDFSGGAEDWTLLPDAGALETGDHHLGALRMSARPEDGIVDIHSRLHSVDNLYVAGSAVFPTGGYANPTLTIVALSLRLADHLKHVCRSK